MGAPQCLDVGFTPPELVLPKNVQDWVLQKQCLDVGFTPPEIVLSETVQDWVLQIQCLDVGFTPPELVLPECSGLGAPDTVSGCRVHTSRASLI